MQFDTHMKLNFVKVEGEKNYHLRVAAILGEVEAEVSSTLDYLQKKSVFQLNNINLCQDLNFVADGLRETA